MAGSSMTLTYDELLQDNIHKITIAWVSDDTTGAVSGSSKKINGHLLKAITVPSGGGTAPTLNYDIAITDGNSFDVLTNCMDNLADRHNANTEEVYFLVSSFAGTDPNGVMPPVVCDVLTFAITNAGNSKEGQVIIYWRPV